MSVTRLRCFFGLHELEYFAGYYRKCPKCDEERAGWGAKHLNPGDRWRELHALGLDVKVNPDDFRNVQETIEK